MNEKKTLEELEEQIKRLRELDSRNGLDLSREIDKLAEKLAERQKSQTKDLDAWSRVKLARHPDRPGSQQYIDFLFEEFYPLHGDRLLGDDNAIIGGFANYKEETLVVIAQCKGGEVEQSQETNFGMVHPEGYRKACRLMELAEKFRFPLLTIVDTPGAYPGKESEEKNIGGTIAESISTMVSLEVPSIAVVIGEGGSGGAVAIGAADRILMLENSIYSVISPEGCAAILWKDRDKAKQAAQELKLTAQDAQDLGIVDDIISEEGKGAHQEFQKTAENLNSFLLQHLNELKSLDPGELVTGRREKYRSIGSFKEVNKKGKQK